MRLSLLLGHVTVFYEHLVISYSDIIAVLTRHIKISRALAVFLILLVITI